MSNVKRLTMDNNQDDIVSCDDCCKNMMSDENDYHELKLCNECLAERLQFGDMEE